MLAERCLLGIICVPTYNVCVPFIVPVQLQHLQHSSPAYNSTSPLLDIGQTAGKIMLQLAGFGLIIPLGFITCGLNNSVPLFLIVPLFLLVNTIGSRPSGPAIMRES